MNLHPTSCTGSKSSTNSTVDVVVINLSEKYNQIEAYVTVCKIEANVLNLKVLVIYTLLTIFIFMVEAAVTKAFFNQQLNYFGL